MSRSEFVANLDLTPAPVHYRIPRPKITRTRAWWKFWN